MIDNFGLRIRGSTLQNLVTNSWACLRTDIFALVLGVSGGPLPDLDTKRMEIRKPSDGGCISD